MLTKWLENDPKVTLVCVIVSAVSLVASITRVLASVLPFDVAWVAIIACGTPILVGAFKGVVFDHDIKADLLVSLALIASVATGEYFAAGEVALIMQIGSLLEDYTSEKARESIERLIDMTPKMARRVRDGKEELVPIEQVQGKAIFENWQERGEALEDVDEFEVRAGQGVAAVIDGAEILVGKPDFMAREVIDTKVCDEQVAQALTEGMTVACVACNGQVAGLIGLADVVRSEAADTIDKLKQLGISPTLLTGDNAQVASTVAGRRHR